MRVNGRSDFNRRSAGLQTSLEVVHITLIKSELQLTTQINILHSVGSMVLSAFILVRNLTF